MKKFTKIFISYSRRDEIKVREIVNRLKKEGFSVFIESEMILPGQSIELVITEAIKASQVILVMLSPHYVKEIWPGLTHQIALKIKSTNPESEKKIIPVLLEPCEIPSELNDLMYFDFYQQREMEKLIDGLYEILTLPLPPIVPPYELAKACAAGDCVLYAGAGLSARTGFPTWSSMAKGLLKWAIKNKFIDRKYKETLQLTLDQGDIDLVIDTVVNELKIRNKKEYLHQFLHDTYLLKPTPLPDAHEKLKKIGFNAILTTNFDNLLENTFDYPVDRVATPDDTEQLLNDLVKRNFFILKLYGSLQKPATVLLAPSEYEESIAGNLPFSEFMESLFFSRTIFFMGTSLEGIEAYLHGIDFRGHVPHQHFALVAVYGKAWQAKANMLERRYGIRVLPYIESKNHPQVIEFLDKLLEETDKFSKEKIIQGFSEEKKHPSPLLKRVRLENIGVFEELDIDFSSNWNVLLGNNGVGKSTILKAIAVGICGAESQPYAYRLIRSGKNEAKIILETERNKYVTILNKKNGGAVVKTIGRFLETEGWLTIGYPPLRAVSWQRPKGPQLEMGKSRPTYEDILPLLTSDPDPRMDKLKQWIITLDYFRSKSQENKKIAGGLYKKLLDEFFYVINYLTEGLSLQFKEVDLETRQVTVLTDDGEIPIEAVSQGTIALIGWIGVLMQRMYEIHSERENPLSAFALLLIDEIDAHMHPQWQQRLIPRLAELFPNIQVIATTHSPLIIGGRQPHEVFILRRGLDARHKVKLEQFDEAFRGWRADQLLTGPLFGLHSSRDVKTQQLLDRYTDLVTRDEKDLSAEDKKELAGIAVELEIRIPSYAERKEAREAFEMIRETWREKLRNIPAREREKLMKEIKAQLQETITGSRRPG